LRPEKFSDFRRVWSSIAFVFAGGMKAESLAHILLVDARPAISLPDAVISLDHYGDLITKALNCGIRNNQSCGPRQAQRKMLVLRMPWAA
jgi:hypothetical protein